MKRFLQVISYILVAAVASCVTLFFCMPSGSDPLDRKLQEVEQLISSRFIGEVDREDLYDSAASGMVAGTGDRWSYYMTAEEYLSYLDTMANAFVGVGITISSTEEGYLEVLKVTPNSGAEAAGAQAGDLVIAVEGKPTPELGTDGAKNLIRGEEGTFVKVTVKRGEQTLELSMERRYIQTPVATATLLDNGIGYVRIENFDSRCCSETVAAIESLLQQDAKALVFDVRNNPGGYKDELVDLLDYLLPEGVLFRSEDYAGRKSTDTSDASCLELPMAVLMNANSYSAAEFFAAALSEYEVGIMVGQATTGKGRFQNTFRLSDGSAVNLSVGRYTTPKGVDLAGVGLTPDIPVEVDEETAAAIYAGTQDLATDPQVQAAVEALLKQLAQNP